MVNRKKSKLSKFIKLVVLLFIVYLFINRQNISTVHIGKNYNSKYSGIGQKQGVSKNGYDTIFVDSNNKSFKEYKQNGNAPWAKNKYWGGTMEENGCGITSISIIASGYGYDVTPEDLRKKYSPHLAGEEISNVLKDSFDLSNTDFLYAEVYFSKKYIINHLLENKPVLVCLWDKPNDSWTEKSHYMVLLATDGDNKIYVSNPNGTKNNNPSGWYDSEEILPYIAKALFIEN